LRPTAWGAVSNVGIIKLIFDKPAGDKRVDRITALSTLPYDGIKIERRYMDDRYTDDQKFDDPDLLRQLGIIKL